MNRFWATFSLFIALSVQSLNLAIGAYLQALGADWCQVLIFSEPLSFVWLAAFWFFFSIYIVYINKNAVNNRFDSNISFLQHLSSIIPPFTQKYRQKWILLLSRAICGVFALIFYLIAVGNIKMINVVVIQTIVISITSVVVGISFFQEDKLGRSNIISLSCTVFGALLVSQPTASLFNDYRNKTRTSTIMIFIGILFAILCGLAKGFVGFTIKHLRKSITNVNWLEISLVSCFVSAIFSIFAYLIRIIYVGSSDDVWWNWRDNRLYGNYDTHLISLLFVSTSLLTFMSVSSYTVAYENGLVSILGILTNVQVFLLYVFDVWMLNGEKNWLSDIGALIVFSGTVTLFFEQYQKRKLKEPNFKDDGNGNGNGMVGKQTQLTVLGVSYQSNIYGKDETEEVEVAPLK